MDPILIHKILLYLPSHSYLEELKTIFFFGEYFNFYAVTQDCGEQRKYFHRGMWHETRNDFYDKFNKGLRIKIESVYNKELNYWLKKKNIDPLIFNDELLNMANHIKSKLYQIVEYGIKDKNGLRVRQRSTCTLKEAYLGTWKV